MNEAVNYDDGIALHSVEDGARLLAEMKGIMLVLTLVWGKDEKTGPVFKRLQECVNDLITFIDILVDNNNKMEEMLTSALGQIMEEDEYDEDPNDVIQLTDDKPKDNIVNIDDYKK